MTDLDYDTPPDYDDAPADNSSLTRVPPQDLAAEQGALGGMLLSKDAIGEVLDVLKPRDYYRPAHELIHHAIVDLYSRDEPADPITVAAELAKRGELTKVGGAGYLHTLVNSVPTAANADYYAAIVQQQAVLRRLIEAGTRIVGMGYAAEGEAEKVVDAAQAELFTIVEQRGEDETLPMSATIDATFDHIEELGRHVGGIAGLATGFADLDALTGGLRGGQMIVIAARPGMGKSTIAMDIARHCSITNGLPSLFLSLEMGHNEINMRILSAEAKVALHHLRTGNVTDDDWTRMARRRQDIHDAPLYVDVTPNMSILDVRTKGRRVKQKHGLNLLVVDYLQLMGAGGRKAENRQLEVAEISRQLKLLAGELDVPVIALSQLNRGPEQRQDKKPAVSDLRESGAIENDADMVILLHREDAYEAASARAGEVDVIVGKHRGGAQATITVAAQLHYSRFVDFTRDEPN